MKKIIAIFGPTTSNKLGFALALSRYIYGKYKIDTEIINSDAKKIYKDFIISQSLPTESFQKVRTHLFGSVSAKKKLDLFDFKKLAQNKISEIHKRNKIPILVGGSELHLLCVLQNWKKHSITKHKKIPKNTIVFGITINKKALKEAVTRNVSKMFKAGLYNEFKKLYNKGPKNISRELLNETLGYRQFLEMALVSKQSPLKLKRGDLKKIKKWMIKDILNYAYHQTLAYKKFGNIHLIKDFKQMKKIIDTIDF